MPDGPATVRWPHLRIQPLQSSANLIFSRRDRQDRGELKNVLSQIVYRRGAEIAETNISSFIFSAFSASLRFNLFFEFLFGRFHQNSAIYLFCKSC